ncbi:hypothetical protein COOONC_10212 [Cooperia oncophora]
MSEITTIERDDNYIVYTVEILPDGCSNSHIVKLIHMTNWPDKGVPPSGRHVLRLLRKVLWQTNSTWVLLLFIVQLESEDQLAS